MKQTPDQLREEIARLRGCFEMIIEGTLCPEAFPKAWRLMTPAERLHCTALLIAEGALKGGSMPRPANYNGCAAIAAERLRQFSEEGWTAEHDDQHVDGSLAMVGACYAHPWLHSIEFPDVPRGMQWLPLGWPPSWDSKWWKPSEDRRRNLVKAGALIAAEIDRLDRLAERERER